MSVSAVIVTRGDVEDLSPIAVALASTPEIDDIVLWDNSEEGVQNMAVYGRYAGIKDAKHELIYVQDDDCVLPPASIRTLIGGVRQQRDLLNGEYLVANMPPEFRHDFYSDHCLVGFGAVFHRDLPFKAFRRFIATAGHMSFSRAPGFRGRIEIESWWLDPLFLRTCDVVFTGLTPRLLLSVPKTNLPWADDATRMYRQPEHIGERQRMLDLVLQVRERTS